MKILILILMTFSFLFSYSQEPSRQVINTGTVANDRTGDGLRTAFTKVNTNLSNLWDNVFWNSDVSTNGIIKRTGAGTYAIVLDYSTNWNTAYGWGNHASAGYLTSQTSHADVVVDGDFTSNGLLKRTSAGVYGIIPDYTPQWNFAYAQAVDTGEITDNFYLKAELYTKIQTDSVVDLKGDKANPAFTGKIRLTPLFTGSYIIGDGGQSLVNTTGSNAFHNILYGSGAGFSLTTGSWNLAAGTDALYTSTVGTYNTAVGFSSMKYSTDAIANSAFGDRSLVLNTTGDYNSAHGSMALYANTTGSNNTAIGYQAGYTNQTGARNVFIGREAGYYETGSDYIYIDNTSRTSEAIGRENAWLVGKLNGNTEVQYIYANGNLRVKEAFIQATDTLTVSSAGNINNISTAVLKVAGRGAAIDITSNPQIAAGTDGQIIELHGTSDTNTLKIDTGTGVLLSTASYTLGNNDVLILRYINGAWKEVNYLNY